MAIRGILSTAHAQPKCLNRRVWLKTTGLAVLGSPLLISTASAQPPYELRAQARQNLRLAVYGPTYADLPLEKAAHQMAEEGFSGVLTDLRFADVQFTPFAPDWIAARAITTAFAKNHLSIASLHGYYNVIDPDASRRRRGRAYVEFLLRNWERLGCGVVSMQTGTRNAASLWSDSPENGKEDAYLECRKELGELAALAEQTGAVLAIEPYWRNVIDSAAKAERLFCEIDSPALKLAMDPCNFLRKEDLPCQQAILCDLFDRLGDQIAIAHAKDVRASAQGIELPAAGRGVLDYPLYLRLLAELNQPCYLVVEHAEINDIARARNFVIGQYAKL